jgi:hypothetical protein
MEKVFLTMVLVFVLFTSGCRNRNDSGGVLRTSSLVQQPVESNKQQESIKSSANTAAPSVIPQESIGTVATAIFDMADFSFGQNIGQNFDSRIKSIERIFFLGAEANYLYNSLRGISENPLAPLFDERDEYENAIDTAHNLALEKTGCVTKVVDSLAFSMLEAKEIARDTVVNPSNAVRNHDEQVRDIARVQMGVQTVLQKLEQVKAYFDSGDLEDQRVRAVLNDANTFLDTTGHGNRAQNISMFTRLMESRNSNQRINVDSILKDLNNAFLKADIKNAINQLNTIINNQNLADFVVRINQLAQLLDN